MRRRAHSCSGAPQMPEEKGGRFAPPPHFRRGFTLLEMCLVLFIIALLAGTMMPAMHSAFVEQAVRNDARHLALMVKTAMLQSSEQHRPYVIDLTATTMALHPLGENPKDTDPSDSDSDSDSAAPTPAAGSDSASTNDDAAPAKNPAQENVDITSHLDSPNKLLAPDPDKPNAWVPMPDATSWLFQPGELCPAVRVRLDRGDAWIEMSFNALTGNVESEASYFP